MNEEEAIKELRNSYELHQCEWAKRCLDIIQTESEKKDKEIEKKDKIIDLMAEYLASIDFDEHCVKVPGICIGCPKEDDLDGYMQCIKQYFERKVENG